MAIASDKAFGFGQGVTGGGDGKKSKVVPVGDQKDLRKALADLGAKSSGPTVVELAASADYDFKNDKNKGEEFTIGAQNLTLRARKGDRVELRNISLTFDLATADNILIEDLAFYSDVDTPGDCLGFAGAKSSPKATNRVRITRCSFDGYRDLAIEMRSYRSLLLGTIDHCFFVDLQPGQGVFRDRGAIDVVGTIDEKSKKRLPGNSYVTVAYNYFQDVWRRSPRAAAEGNHIHVFNNLLYRWGFGNDQDENGPKDLGTATWNGMTIGNSAQAVIQANRFIPWDKKATGKSARKVLSHDVKPGEATTVDIGIKAGLPNEFDSPEGAPTDKGPLIPDPKDFQTIQVAGWYKTVKLDAPTVPPTGKVDWSAVVQESGPRVKDPREIVITPPGVK
jgi:pectate lyase